MQTTFSIGQFRAIKLRFDEATVNAYGDVTAPRLILQPRLSISYPEIGQGRRLQFICITAQLQFDPMLMIDALPSPLNVAISAACPAYDDYVITLEFPLTPAIITRLETQRNGGSLKARLRATIEFHDLRLAVRQGTTEVWGFCDRYLQSASEELQFPASAWTGRVLPGVGYGMVHLIELPATPLAQVGAFDDAFKALEQARARHASGLYDDAAAKCRIALDKFFGPQVVDVNGEKKTIPKLKAAWESRLGKATYDWLDSALGAVKAASNPTHHSPNQHFDQLESQMLLAVTASLVAYAARYGQG